MLKKLILMLVWILPLATFASGGNGLPLMHANINLHDKASLQRGAKYYMNYCAGCHSLQYMRYNRMAKDIGIVDPDQQIDVALLQNNLIFNDVKVFDFITNAIPVSDAHEWFGVLPPDLTLETRVRSSDWLFTYLLTFYRDPTRPWGVNNWLFPDVAMPNVLANLQGEQVAVYRNEIDTINGEQKSVTIIDHLQQLSNGSMSGHQFEETVRDITNFLTYVAEPGRLDRYRIGVWAILFTLVFAILAYFLKREFWLDIKKK